MKKKKKRSKEGKIFLHSLPVKKKTRRAANRNLGQIFGQFVIFSASLALVVKLLLLKRITAKNSPKESKRIEEVPPRHI